VIADTTAPGSDLYEAVELARQAAQAEAGEHPVGRAGLRVWQNGIADPRHRRVRHGV